MSNPPPHYDFEVEPIDAIKSWLSKEEYAGYLRGNVIKYISRFRRKGGLEDLEKAKWYLGRLFENEYVERQREESRASETGSEAFGKEDEWSWTYDIRAERL